MIRYLVALWGHWYFIILLLFSLLRLLIFRLRVLFLHLRKIFRLVIVSLTMILLSYRLWLWWRLARYVWLNLYLLKLGSLGSVNAICFRIFFRSTVHQQRVIFLLIDSDSLGHCLHLNFWDVFQYVIIFWLDRGWRLDIVRDLLRTVVRPRICRRRLQRIWQKRL